jgi:hypothetical protein
MLETGGVARGSTGPVAGMAGLGRADRPARRTEHGNGSLTRRRRLARALVAAGVIVLAAALGLGLLPVSPSSCGSLLAPAFPHAVRSCSDAQTSFLPSLLAAGALGLAMSVSGVIALPQRSRRRPHRHG